MEGEYVFGSRIFVRYLGKDKGNIIAKNLGTYVGEILAKSDARLECQAYCNNTLSGSIITRSRAVSDSEIVTDSKQSNSKQMYAASASVLGTRTLQFPHFQSSSSVVGAYPAFNPHCAPINGPPSGLVCEICLNLSFLFSESLTRYLFFFNDG